MRCKKKAHSSGRALPRRIAIRVTYVTFAVKFFPVLRTVSWAYPITWGLSTLVFTLYYFKSDWMHAFEKRERRA